MSGSKDGGPPDHRSNDQCGQRLRVAIDVFSLVAGHCTARVLGRDRIAIRADRSRNVTLQSIFVERPKEFVNVKKAAGLVQTSESTVRRWIRLREVDAVRVGRTLWVHVPSLEGKIQEPGETSF